MPIVAVAGVIVWLVLRADPAAHWIAGGAALGLIALIVIIHRLGLSQAKPTAAGLAVALAR